MFECLNTCLCLYAKGSLSLCMFGMQKWQDNLEMLAFFVANVSRLFNHMRQFSGDPVRTHTITYVVPFGTCPPLLP